MTRRSFLLSSAAAVCSAAGAANSDRYVPVPRPVRTDPYLVGAMTCPLWREGTRGKVWAPLAGYPERTPLLGYYDEGDPEVTDWEVKWAVEHGIGFFMPCWFRARGNQGRPVQTVLGHWLHDGLFHCRYGHMVQFAIMWENVNGIACGVESERDLLDHVLPYWIEHYFGRANYLREEGKPVLFLYGPQALAGELGGAGKMRAAWDQARKECERAGLGGLVIYGEHHSDRRPGDDDPVRQMAAGGLDASFSYHWPTFTSRKPAGLSPEPRAMADAQEACWRDLAAGPLPTAVTISMGWDSRPWGASFSSVRWHLPPAEFERLCRRARASLGRPRGTRLADRMVLLDNWNEFGEGHYIAPTDEYRFGYLDAIRRVFGPRAGRHTDVTPREVGLGPYDRLWQATQGR